MFEEDEREPLRAAGIPVDTACAAPRDMLAGACPPAGRRRDRRRLGADTNLPAPATPAGCAVAACADGSGRNWSGPSTKGWLFFLP